MAMLAVVELLHVLNANGVFDDIIALPPPQNPHKTRCVSDTLNGTIVLTSANP
jgi:hypothetical protein